MTDLTAYVDWTFEATPEGVQIAIGSSKPVTVPWDKYRSLQETVVDFKTLPVGTTIIQESQNSRFLDTILRKTPYNTWDEPGTVDEVVTTAELHRGGGVWKILDRPLPERKFEAGDIVKGVDALEELPVGAVIKINSGTVYQKWSTDWATIGDERTLDLGFLDLPATVLDVPTQSL